MQSGEDFLKDIQRLEAQGKEAIIERDLMIKKALSSGSADVILKAQTYLSQIEKRTETNQKSMLIDPMMLTTSIGFKEKQIKVSYTVLRKMSYIPVIKAIIETRKEQILSFCEPQADKYSTGFIVRPKRKSYGDNNQAKITTAQQKEIDRITDFILNCGTNQNEWHGDSFESITRKCLQDSLALDQLCFEVIHNKKGEPIEWLAVDGATVRLADNTDKFGNTLPHIELVNGYAPLAVQTYMNKVIAEFYPWELCFGIRNPSSDIYSNGYGRSELEDLIETVTSLLNADQYNANYFKVGSNPKGILKVTGNINESRIQEFRAQWQTQMAGVNNAHKLPIIEAEKMDFISTQGNNKDMEYSKYYEFLLKIACAVYKIDPSEIGFPMSGSSDAKPMFEGNNEARLKYSRDKGLKPLLKFYQQKIQRYIIERLNPEYELIFSGIDSETAEQQLEADIKKVTNYQTVNEIRKKNDLKDLPDGDIILNPVMLQNKQMAMMGDPESNEAIDQEDENPFNKAVGDYLEKLS